jgi:hypothetical protein
MTIKQIYDVTDNHLVINLPKSFQSKKRVMVTVDDEINARERKIALMKLALSDKMLQDDINEIADDFKFVDAE